NDELNTTPAYFDKYIVNTYDTAAVASLVRSPFSNATVFHPGKTDRVRKWTKPFISDPSVVIALLADTLDRRVTLIQNEPVRTWKTLYSVPADSVYKVMMQDSDNFIA